MVHTRVLVESEDLKYDWIGLLSAYLYGIRSTHLTTLKEGPGQLLF